MKMTPERIALLRHRRVAAMAGLPDAISDCISVLPAVLDDLEEAIRALVEMRRWLLGSMDEHCPGCGVPTDWELLEDIPHKEECHLEATLKFVYSALRQEFRGQWQED